MMFRTDSNMARRYLVCYWEITHLLAKYEVALSATESFLAKAKELMFSQNCSEKLK